MAGKNAVSILITAEAAQAIAKINETALATGRLDAAAAKSGLSWAKAGQKMTSVGHSMTRNLTLPIAIAGGAAVKTAIDFNTSLNHIQALVGASSKQMEEYRKAILALGPAVGKGPKELSDALYFITSSGFKGAAALRILSAGARASAAGLGDTQTVVDLVTSAVNAYGEKSLSAAKATDVLTAAVREGKAEPQDLAKAMGRVIPIAQAMGVSFGEVSGTVASLTLSGLDAAEAVTSVRTTMSELLKPSAGAKTALHDVGVSVGELQKRVADKGLQNALIFLNDKFHGNRQELGKVITQQRAFAGVLALIGPNADKAAKTISAVGGATGDTGVAFKKATESDMFKFNQALAELQVTGVKVGDSLIPILTTIAEDVGSVAAAFEQLSPTMQKVVIDGALIAAALGPVLIVGGNVIKVVQGMAAAYALLVPAQEAAAASSTLVAANSASMAAGISGFTAEAGGAEAASLGLAGALGPAGIVGAGLLAVGVFIKVTHGLGGQSHALEDATGKAQAYAQALQGIQPAQLGLKEATAAHVEALKAYRTAQQAVTTDVQKGLKGSQQYRDDLVAQQQAHFNVTGTLLAQRSAQGQLNDAQRKAIAAQKQAAGGLEELSRDAQKAARAQENLNNRFGGQIQQAGGAALKLRLLADQANAFSGKTRTLAASQEALARKLGGMGTQAGIAETKVAAMSLAASHLTDQLGHVPTQKQIRIYYAHNLGDLIRQAQELGAAIDHLQSKQLSVTTTFRTYHVQSGPSKGNAAGGVSLRPMIFGGAPFAEAGTGGEAMLPLGSPGGQRALSQALRKAGAGGNTVLNFNFPGVVIADGQAVKRAVTLAMPEIRRQMARRA